MAAARMAPSFSGGSADQRTRGWAGLDDDLGHGTDPMPGGAAQFDADRLRAAAVQMDSRWALGVGQVAVTPALERCEQGEQFAARVGQVVFASLALTRVAIMSLFQQPCLGQAGQAPAEHWLGDPEVVVDVSKSMQPAEHLAQDVQHPRFADHVEGSADTAVTGVLISPLHEPQRTGFL